MLKSIKIESMHIVYDENLETEVESFQKQIVLTYLKKNKVAIRFPGQDQRGRHIAYYTTTNPQLTPTTAIDTTTTTATNPPERILDPEDMASFFNARYVIVQKGVYVNPKYDVLEAVFVLEQDYKYYNKDPEFFGGIKDMSLSQFD
ncbi:hypothetical protein H4219_005531 [Mycoemilia scoparia]|uniref:Uncharacterized protein n=1 Tax=Mycoemilia scoparia TaxID=417184 RepID=A0A9W8DP44_9FUNG|nr:hypothetical protein H4219_005531 [Mycoemilia scoparia]